MNILVTGSEGHIGKYLVKKLKELNHNVLRMDIVQLYQDGYIMCAVTNLSDAYAKIDAFKPEVIYHLAAAVSRVTSEESPYNTFHVNVCGTSNIVQLAIKYNAKLINFSTSQIYGDIQFNDDQLGMSSYQPNNIYGLSKWMGQRLAKYYEKDIVVINLRLHMIYDTEQKLLNNRSALIRFVKWALTNEDIIVHRNSYRGWLHMTDAIQLLVNVMDIEQSMSLNIGTKDMRSMEDVAYLIKSLVPNCSSRIIIKDMPDKMCRYKYPKLKKQQQLLKYEPKIILEQALPMVIDSARKRLND